MEKAKTDFDWERVVGNVDPCQVEKLARQSDQTLEDFARDFIKRWPFGGEPSQDEINQVVEKMRGCPRK